MPVTQPKHTYSDTTPHKTAITDAIDIISPDDVPVVKYFGLNGNPGQFDVVNWPSTKVYWLEDKLAELETTGDGTNAVAKTDSTVGVSSDIFKTGDVISIDGDKMWVKSTASGSITVKHDWDGSSTSHANDATIEIIGNARLEGSDADYERGLTDVSSAFNYTQIFQDDLRITRSMNKISQYGKVGEEFDYQAAKKVPELSRLIEKTFFQGVRKSGKNVTSARAFGGVEQFIASGSNTTAISAAITRKDIEDCIQSCWDDGGNPNLIICNGWVKRKIDAMFEGFVRTGRDESRGGVMISDLDTNYGPLSILMSRWCPKDTLYVVESDYIGFLAYDPFFQEMLAKTGDAIKGQVVGEYTLVVKNAQAHGYITSISTTS